MYRVVKQAKKEIQSTLDKLGYGYKCVVKIREKSPSELNVGIISSTGEHYVGYRIHVFHDSKDKQTKEYIDSTLAMAERLKAGLAKLEHEEEVNNKLDN